jgi:ribosome-binding protein aMBF1 (putative translation factor)
MVIFEYIWAIQAARHERDLRKLNLLKELRILISWMVFASFQRKKMMADRVKIFKLSKLTKIKLGGSSVKSSLRLHRLGSPAATRLSEADSKSGKTNTI